MRDVFGNTLGLKQRQLHSLRRAYRRRVDAAQVISPELSRHLLDVAQTIGKAQMAAFQPVKVGLSIVGLEVRHVHLHVIPIREAKHMDFANAEKTPSPAALDEAAAKLRATLKSMGRREVAA